MMDMVRDEPAGAEAPPGERQGDGRIFAAAEIASAFDIEVARVQRAIQGEFGGSLNGVSSRQAQQLAELLLVDEPLDRRTAALMSLGAFTPRPDVSHGVGDSRLDEESDRQASEADVPETERSSKRSSHDPATQPEG